MQWLAVFVATLIAIAVFGPSERHSTPEFSTQSTSITSPDEYPQRPVKVIVPFGAGGGSDTFVRILQKAIEENDLLPQPIVIINVPGAGGAIGSRQVMESEPDGYTLLCLHEGIITTKYAGSTDYGPEAFEPIAGTGEVGTVIAVAEDASYADLNQLLSDAAARPDQVVFSANIGAPSHFAGLMLEKAKPGARFRYTQTGGGAKRFAALAGGHIDVSSFSFAEYMQFKSAGLRALAYCGESRHPAAPNIPTATEQGFEVISTIMQFWWAPKNTPQQRINAFADVLEKSLQTRLVVDRLAAIHTEPEFITGIELQDALVEREKRIANVAQRELIKLPDFPKLVLAMVVMLLLVVAFQEIKRRNRDIDGWKKPDSDQPEYQRRPAMAVTAVCLTSLYVFVMQGNWVDFRTATAIYIFGLGLLLMRVNLKQLPILATVAIVTSLGLHFVFTNLVTVPLP